MRPLQDVLGSSPPSIMDLPVPMKFLLDGSPSPLPSGEITVGVDFFILVVSAVTVLATSMPLFLCSITGSKDKILQMSRVPGLWVSIVNSITWILLKFIAVKKDHYVGLNLAHPLIIIINFTQLLLIYPEHKKTQMAKFTCGLFALSIIFIMSATDPHFSLPKAIDGIGVSCILTGMVTHCPFAIAIYSAAGWSDYVGVSINVIPTGALSAVSVFILQKNPEQKYLWVSSLMGTMFSVLEFVILLVIIIQKKCYGDGNELPESHNCNVGSPDENNASIPNNENGNTSAGSDGVPEDYTVVVIGSAAAGSHSFNVVPSGAQQGNNITQDADLSLQQEVTDGIQGDQEDALCSKAGLCSRSYKHNIHTEDQHTRGEPEKSDSATQGAKTIELKNDHIPMSEVGGTKLKSTMRTMPVVPAGAQHENNVAQYDDQGPASVNPLSKGIGGDGFGMAEGDFDLQGIQTPLIALQPPPIPSEHLKILCSATTEMQHAQAQAQAALLRYRRQRTS